MGDNPSVESEAMGELVGEGISCRESSLEVGAPLAREPGCPAEEYQPLPDAAHMGLSCANPAALEDLSPGEAVVVLGCGLGFDVFLAGRKVGSRGRSIGVDLRPEILVKARRSADAYRRQSGLDNVDFRLGEIEYFPIADGTVDTVICNSVINVSSNKPQVWREMARVLKRGGRVVVSDTALLKPLPAVDVLNLLEALVGCVAGAVLVTENERIAREAGFRQIVLKVKPRYIELMTNWEDPLYQEIMKHLPPGAVPGDYITSLEIEAFKPEARGGHKVL